MLWIRREGGGAGALGGVRIHCRACHVRRAQDRNLSRISQGHGREREGAFMSPSSSAQRLSRGKLAPEMECIQRKMWNRLLLHVCPSLTSAPWPPWPPCAFLSPTGRLHARPRLAPCCSVTGAGACSVLRRFQRVKTQHFRKQAPLSFGPPLGQ